MLNGLPTDEQWSKAEAELAERMLEGSVRIVTACEASRYLCYVWRFLYGDSCMAHNAFARIMRGLLR